MSEQGGSSQWLRFDPEVCAEFNAGVAKLFANLAEVPRRMAAVERVRREQSGDTR